jgi:hypothetical protein
MAGWWDNPKNRDTAKAGLMVGGLVIGGVIAYLLFLKLKLEEREEVPNLGLIYGQITVNGAPPTTAMIRVRDPSGTIGYTGTIKPNGQYQVPKISTSPTGVNFTVVCGVTDPVRAGDRKIVNLKSGEGKRVDFAFEKPPDKKPE